MENIEMIKNLKKELLELEGSIQENPKHKAANNYVSGVILLGVGAVCLAIGIGNDTPVSSFTGAISLIIGFVMISKGVASVDAFEEKQKERDSRILAIKKQLIDLE